MAPNGRRNKASTSPPEEFKQQRRMPPPARGKLRSKITHPTLWTPFPPSSTTPEFCQATAARCVGQPWNIMRHNPSQNQPEILDQTIDITIYQHYLDDGHHYLASEEYLKAVVQGATEQ